jgi:nucleoside-diphosphate-sugar epimerase
MIMCRLLNVVIMGKLSMHIHKMSSIAFGILFLFSIPFSLLAGYPNKEQNMNHGNKQVLIAGASGLVGNAALEQFLSDGWEVIAVSRRKPIVESKRPFRHISVDLTDKERCRQVFSTLTNVEYVVFAALSEKPNALLEGWYDPNQMEINRQMLINLMEPLSEASKIMHVSLLQGTKAYGIHIPGRKVPIPARENQPRDPHENFYWLQEDYIVQKSRDKGFAYTILRPPGILGSAYGTAMSITPVIGAYGAICRELGEPFRFPGGASTVLQFVDVRLLARVLVWATTEPKAINRTFNVLNGDVADWRNLWPALAKTLGLEIGEDRPLELKVFMPAHADIWDRIVKKYKLQPIPMKDLLGESHHFADIMFGYGMDQPGSPTFTTDYELRKAGFNEFVDTETALCEMLQKLIDQKILPPAN